MSLVGTRPILQDELQKYELHHRARIAIKPGILCLSVYLMDLWNYIEVLRYTVSNSCTRHSWRCK